MNKRKTIYNVGYVLLSLNNFISDRKRGAGLGIHTARKKILHCSYFSGRNFQTKEFWYSPNDIMGKSMCPFLYSY